MGFGQLFSGLLRGQDVVRVTQAMPAPHRYCLRCDVPFSSGPRCPGCGGPGVPAHGSAEDPTAADTAAGG